ncbi:MAG: alpha/beta fold hydrolase [Armatimonadota bacterium]|nr:alpha/beta fold hydrolase [Armatimonadota bacterium]MDR7452769.1 alpha/beta fold hydrolase [Armatimonadota bacterium]MDR7494579.1 alpha/beta fold hydrolase [Armatimonadota bacterium]MDR7505934.1 alpha/beta fold hydrolase [Armatimonadota bacterium]MDR7548180.1 alpha/beta fold hydrolase [Armatimonadota bacterium]
MKITHRGVDLAYDDQGAGTPVVLLHGFPFSRKMWARQVAALAPVCRVVTPDLRGFGESAGVPETVDQLADDLHTLVEALALPAVVLGGFSMGGYVAFRYLAAHGDRVRALMLLDTRAEADTPEARERRFAGIDRIRREGPAGFLDDFVRLVAAPSTLERRPDLVAEIRALMEGTRVESLIGGLRAMAARPDSTPLLGGIRVPALIVVGEDDRATPVESSRAMAAAIPDAELIIIPGAGHVSNLEQPDAFNRALLRFLKRLS